VSDTGWTPVKRTVAARFVNLAVPIGMPAFGAAAVTWRSGFEERGNNKVWPREVLWLELEDFAGTEATNKLGDTWVRGELDADGLVAIADHLDQPSASPYRQQLAEWLRDYARRPRAADWPRKT
jgi:hypothetical protein